MIRKGVAAFAISAGIAAASLATAGSAAAAQGVPAGVPVQFVPAGVYPSMQACGKAGNAGFPQDRWIGFTCETLDHGQTLLWVQPR